MRGKPILFSAPMVRAILAGRKTQTRRILKPQPLIRGGAATRRRLPYAPGDLLWVRETWRLTHVGGGRGGDVVPFNSYEVTRRATELDVECFTFEGEEDPFIRFASDGWRPSIHMPRWASRLTLEVESVKVERVQEISEADAEAEGVTKVRDHCYVIEGFDYDLAGLCHSRATIPFAKLWDHINGPDAWDANPWVVAVTFRAHHANIDAMAYARLRTPEEVA